MDAAFGSQDFPSGVWAFGSCMLHMVTGQLSFEGPSHMQLMSAMFKRLPDVPSSLPTWLQQTLKQCLHFDTKARPTIDSLYK